MTQEAVVTRVDFEAVRRACGARRTADNNRLLGHAIADVAQAHLDLNQQLAALNEDALALVKAQFLKLVQECEDGLDEVARQQGRVAGLEGSTFGVTVKRGYGARVYTGRLGAD